MERRGMLQSVVGRYGTLWKHYGVLLSITELYRALQDVTGRFGMLRKRCRSIRNISLLLIT